MLQEWVRMFRGNFPFAVRRESTLRAILSDENNRVLEERDDAGNLVGVSAVHGDTVLLLCVEKSARGKGIGSRLLAQSEAIVSTAGYRKIRVGAGFDYLTPGVPSRSKIYAESLGPENIYPELDDSAVRFFQNRGYRHGWADSNCFDMRMPLSDCPSGGTEIGETSAGITYVWAKREDLPAICACTDDAHREFTQYYQNPELYIPQNNERVLLAKDGETVIGTLIVGAETEAENVGSVGCTAVRHAYRGRHIATTLVQLGTKHLRDIGLQTSFLGYTYSGLDKMYGSAGYKICVYYFMAEKDLP